MQDTHQILTGLIATCRDSEDRFGKAGEQVHTNSLRNRLTAIARQRADFAAELSDCLKPHGAEPPQSPHQRELTIRPKDDTTLIAQCFEGEENTLRHYESALTHDLPAPIRPVVDRQRLAVQEALLNFHGMEMLRKAS
ncbi:MAG TPA: PA2169 family four-helix-bundle protein [Candidatus Limnocylindrales bacterium]|nr:PA2169 family four-helix-bundle protein [Candidatus Limnocylindrales bacterium]